MHPVAYCEIREQGFILSFKKEFCIRRPIFQCRTDYIICQGKHITLEKQKS